MRKTVYKYALHSLTENELELPKGAELLSVKNQNDRPYLWALVDTDEIEIETRTICLFGTGHTIENSTNFEYQYKFIDTVMLLHGDFVIHVFEKIYKNVQQ